MQSKAASRYRIGRAAAASGLALALSGAGLVAGVLVPSFADHEDPVRVEDGSGGNTTCEDRGFTAPPSAAEWDDGGKVDPPVAIDNAFVTTSLTFNDEDEPQTLDVTAKDGFVVTAVIVKGGPASNVYSQPPFHDMESPPFPVGHPQAGKVPAISHYVICGHEVPNGTETPTPEPTDTPTKEPTEPPTPEPTDTPTKEPTETPTPEPTDTPTAGPTKTPPPTTPPTPGLPVTGAGGALLALAGAGLLIGGTALALFGRRFAKKSAG